MKDTIYRADAIEAVGRMYQAVKNSEPYPQIWHYKDFLTDALFALPSAGPQTGELISREEPTVIRSRTFMPTKDFKEWAKRIREENPNAVVIPCDAEVVSAEAVQGEWDVHEDIDGEYGICSVCGKDADFSHYGEAYNYCPNCGARMKGGDDE